MAEKATVLKEVDIEPTLAAVMDADIRVLRLALDHTPDEWMAMRDEADVTPQQHQQLVILAATRCMWDLLGMKIDILAGRPWEKCGHT